MRILTITNWYPPHHSGGYELSCFDVMARLESRGHWVDVLCNRDRSPAVEDPSTTHEQHVRRELLSYVQNNTLLTPSLRESLAFERHNQRALETALAELDPEVVSIWQMGALSLGMLTTLTERGIPLVYSICDNWLGYGTLLDSWAKRFNGSRRRRCLGRVVGPALHVPTVLPDLGESGAFCWVSEFTRRRSIESSPWSRFPISAVVYSGIERSLFSPAPAETDREWDWRLLYVGRLDPRKGVRTVLRAMPMLPDATLRLIGPDEGGERARLECLARELGVATRVQFGERQRDELVAEFRNADALVFPSEWEEPFGLVPIEAMACGTPVLGTGVGGSGEILEDRENCLLFEAGNPSALAAGVRNLADDLDDRRHIIAGGLRLADELTTDHLADAFDAWHHAASSGFAGELPRSRTRRGSTTDGGR